MTRNGASHVHAVSSRTTSSIAKFADRLVIRAYRASGGRIPAKAKGAPLLLLTTTGARSGLPRTTPVVYLWDSGTLLIVGTNGGQNKQPSWCSNLRAEPAGRVEIGSDTVEVRATELTGEERDRRWAMMTDRYPALRSYQSKTDRVFPIFAVQQLPGSAGLRAAVEPGKQFTQTFSIPASRADRFASYSAVLSGVTGLIANLALILFYVLAKPWHTATSGWSWWGPVNDVVGAASMGAFIPVIVQLGRRVPGSQLLRVLGWGSVAAAAALVLVVGPMLLGWLPLAVQFAVAGVGLPVLFGWIWVINRTGLRTRTLPRGIARWGVCIGAGAVAGTALAVVGIMLAWGSTGQYVLLGIGAALGLPAYLAFPIWVIVLGRRVFGEQPPLVLQVATTVGGQWEPLEPINLTSAQRSTLRR